MDATSPSQKRRKRQRFQPFVIRKGIVMRAKQRQKTTLELSKSKNDSTMYNDPKLTELRFNNRSLSRALTEQKMENKCLADEKIQLQREMLANHEIILALRSELQTHEDDLLQIHEVFRSSLQLLVTLTGHLNVGLQRCTAGRRRSKSVSMGTAGAPRASRSFSMAGLTVSDGSAGPSPRQSGAGGGATSRKLHKVLPTVAGNVISHPSIVLPRLPPGGGWFAPPPPGGRRSSDVEGDMEEEEPEEEEEEPEPLAEPGERIPTSVPLADLSVILEQSVLDADVVSPLRRSRLEAASPAGPARRLSASPRPPARRSVPLLHAQVVVPAEERLFGDEAWMRQRSPGLERVVVAAEERLYGDEAWLRQRCRGPARVLVSADERLSGDEVWRRSDGDGTESPTVAGRGSAQTAASRRARPSVAPGQDTDRAPLSASSAAAGDSAAVGRGTASPSSGTPADRPTADCSSRSHTAPATALCNGDVSAAVAASPSADLEESVVIQRRTQRTRAAARPSTVPADETLPGHPDTEERDLDTAPADPDESVVVSRRDAAPNADESILHALLAAADQDESIIVSRKAPAAQKTAAPDADESIIVSRRAAAPDPDESILASCPPAEPDADQSVVISRKVRGRPRSSVAPVDEPQADADESVIISRKVRGRPRSSVAPADSPPAAADESVVIARKTRQPGPSVAQAAEQERAPAAPRRGRKSKAGRERQPPVITVSPEPAVISREEATPSPELGVKERYRHTLGRRSPRSAGDSRVAPPSADDPLEGPSNRVWLAAASPEGRRSRGRPRASPSPRAVSGTSLRSDDFKLASPVVVLVDRAAADSQPAAKRGRRRRAVDGAAGDGADVAAASPPAAKRGRGRGRGGRGRGGGGRGRGGGRGGGGGGVGRGGGGGGRGRRRSVAAEPLPPVPVPDWTTMPAVAEDSSGKTDAPADAELFVYPDLPPVQPETEPERSDSRRSVAEERRAKAGQASSESAAVELEPVRPAETDQPEGDGAAVPAADGAGAAQVALAGAPPSPGPAAAEPSADKLVSVDEPAAVAVAPSDRSEVESVSGSAASRRPPEATGRPVVVAEPSSTTGPPLAVEPSTSGPPRPPESSNPAPPVVAEVSNSATVEAAKSSVPVRPVVAKSSDQAPSVMAESSAPAPSVVAESSDQAPAVMVESSIPVPSVVAESSDQAPHAAAESSVPASPERPRQTSPSLQGSPGSEDLEVERPGRRRRKPISYVEPSLSKKLRRQR